MIEQQLLLFPELEIPTSKKVVNVSTVPQRSPFRYAGGKTWLIPTIRKWLRGNNNILVEPFLGGGSISLTAAIENLTPLSIMVELDHEVASVWKTILGGDSQWLINQIRNFNLTKENVMALLAKEQKSTKELGFCTLIKNRVFHGGILAHGAGLMKKGETGKGIGSRWYPDTLCRRISNIYYHRNLFEFHEGDAFSFIRKYKDNPNYNFFIDPPYTVAGKRLYNLFDIDHEELFRLVSSIAGHYIMTYDNCDDVKNLAAKYGLNYTTIPMTTTHLLEKEELIISDNLDWMEN